MSEARKPLILIVEDEADIVTLLRYNLVNENYAVEAVGMGLDGLRAAENLKPDLILLDWMLPDIEGVEVCRLLREKNETSDIPVIMITARGEETDRIEGLDMGADDYMVKPFSPRELLARIAAVLRRVTPKLPQEVLRMADIVMDMAAHRVRRGGIEIHLGPTEFRLLRHFMVNPGMVYSREELLEQVWLKDIYVELRTVDVHIRRLRKALEIEGKRDPIRTVRSAGYSLSPDLAA